MTKLSFDLIKTAEQYVAVIDHQIRQYRAGLKVERVDDDAVIIRVGRISERVSDDALVALATAGRMVTTHDIAVLSRKVERKTNEHGLLFAKVVLA